MGQTHSPEKIGLDVIGPGINMEPLQESYSRLAVTGVFLDGKPIFVDEDDKKPVEGLDQVSTRNPEPSYGGIGFATIRDGQWVDITEEIYE